MSAVQSGKNDAALPLPQAATALAARNPRRNWITILGNATRQLIERLIAALAIVALAPLIAVIAVAVCLTSAGPAFFRQERIGKDGRRFQIFKFRTMVDGSDRMLKNLLALHGRQGQPLFKVPDDPRITPLGRFMRRHSIDELPQLFNVLRGEMAFVGPRPQRPEEVALYSAREKRRLAVLPGITGMWQVNGRSMLPWHRAVELDLQYVEERSLLLDLKIVLRTVVIVFTGRGAQ
jgi:lipopolysaccharide/colanic/teichoic acid biosynthesis glycosyltransferase